MVYSHVGLLEKSEINMAKYAYSINEVISEVTDEGDENSPQTI